MALISDYGKAASNPGKAFFYGVDADTQKNVSFVVRQLPLDIEESFKQRYVRKQRSRSTGLTSRDFDNRYTLEFLCDRVCWMWVDSINLEIHIPDEKAAEFYREHITDITIEAGSNITLDGRLSDAIRRRIVTNNPDIADFIVDKALDIRDDSTREDQGKG